MAQDNKVLIEIVLDDGSVKRGFATIQKESQATGKEIETNLNKKLDLTPKSLTDIAAGFLIVREAVRQIGSAIQSAFNFVLAGERVQAVEQQFNNLARSAGLSGEQLRSALDQAADGLIDTGDLLEQASIRVAQLGSNAAQLPAILDASRKVALATGQSIQDVFNQVSQSVATGQTRTLRQLGIITDLDKATQDYAATLGLSTKELTEQQIQAARINAVLGDIGRRFGNVDASLRPATDAFTRLNVQINEAVESLQRIASNSFGGVFARLANDAAKSLEDFNDRANASKNSVEGINSAIRVLNREAQLLAQIIENPFQNQNRLAAAGVVNLEQARAKYAQINAQLKQYTDLLSVQEEEQRKATEASRADVVIQELKQAADQNAAASLQARSQNLQAFRQAELAALQSNLQTRLNINSQIVADEERINERVILLKQQQKLFNDQFIQDQAAINKQFSDEQGFSAEERERLIQEAKAREVLAVQQANDQIKQLEEDKNNAIKFGSIEAYQSINAATQNFIKTTGTALATTLGAALVNGASAFSDFNKVVLNLVGDLLINVGQAIVFTGKAVDALAASLTSLFGGFAIVGGLALIALGGALKAAGGGALTSAATGGGTTDLGTGATAADLTQTQTADLERQPNTIINVAFEGDVIGDSADTGSRIVSLINDAFDKQGVVLRQQTV